ncbi:MAG TPA: hypothetical protein VGH92_00620 [Gaiellaceae bacterium]
MIKFPVSIGALRKLIKELNAADDRKPVAIGGAAEIARTLERELTRGGDPTAVRVGAPGGAAVYVHIGGDEAALKAARKARVPIVAIAFDEEPLPYVYATDVVQVGPGEPLPIESIAKAIAARLDEAGAPLAARLPVLRRAVCDRIVASFARKNGILGAAVFVPGADLPVLALNQVRMLLLLDQAYGLELDPVTKARSAEILATVGAGLGLRAAARELLDFVPVAGWLVKGGVAYAGTRALGEAAIRRLELVHAS